MFQTAGRQGCIAVTDHPACIVSRQKKLRKGGRGMKKRTGKAAALTTAAAAVIGAVFYKTKICRRKFHKIKR